MFLSGLERIILEVQGEKSKIQTRIENLKNQFTEWSDSDEFYRAVQIVLQSRERNKPLDFLQKIEKDHDKELLELQIQVRF